jgi:hypothetical protein
VERLFLFQGVHAEKAWERRRSLALTIDAILRHLILISSNLRLAGKEQPPSERPS